ncbi:hypothetical protein NQZ68_007746 [Dissostichus eleginoides]|nr:hypothetical protein NQZ68_007746 [Dissostichus eleginoides]
MCHCSTEVEAIAVSPKAQTDEEASYYDEIHSKSKKEGPKWNTECVGVRADTSPGVAKAPSHSGMSDLGQAGVAKQERGCEGEAKREAPSR